MPQLRAMVVALIGGLAGHLSGLPGGALVGALIAVALLTRWRPTRLPRAVTLIAQLLIGTAAGALVTRNTMIELWQPLLYGFGISVLVVAVSLGCGLALTRFTDLDPLSSMLAFVPGGLSEIAALAEDYEIHTEFVITVHLMRRIITVILVVTIAAWALR
jgi:uncharacterized protein